MHDVDADLAEHVKQLLQFVSVTVDGPLLQLIIIIALHFSLQSKKKSIYHPDPSILTSRIKTSCLGTACRCPLPLEGAPLHDWAHARLVLRGESRLLLLPWGSVLAPGVSKGQEGLAWLHRVMARTNL